MTCIACDTLKTGGEIGVVWCFHVALATFTFAACDWAECIFAVISVLATHKFSAVNVTKIAFFYFFFWLWFFVVAAAKFGTTV